MKPYYEHAGIAIYHGDSLGFEFPLSERFAIVTDPPYGIDWMPRVRCQESIVGDKQAFDPRPWLAFGERHLFWGANHFHSELPSRKSWFIWLKQPATFDECRKSYAPCEMAWSDFGGHPRIKHHTWDGNFRAGMDAGTFLHPAQKPQEVMEWCIGACESPMIIDPYMGSGTTLVAAKNLGRKAIGIEIEERYCEIAAKRLSQEVFEFPSEPCTSEASSGVNQSTGGDNV